jgi:hypothetical protein
MHTYIHTYTVVDGLFNTYNLFDGYDQFDTLNFSNTCIDGSSFTYILTSLKGLKHICINNCTSVPDKAIAYISKQCPDLHTLCVRACVNITSSTLEDIARNCTGIQVLDVSMLGGGTDSRAGTGITSSSNSNSKGVHTTPNKGKGYGNHGGVMSPVTHASSSSLSFSGAARGSHGAYPHSPDGGVKSDHNNQEPNSDEDAHLLLENPPINDAVVTLFSQKLLQLTSLNLRGCIHATSAGVLSLCSCTALTNLKLAGCERVEEYALLELCMSSVPLTNADFSDLDASVTDEVVRQLVLNKTSLTKLNLTNAFTVTPRGMVDISTYGRLLVKLKLTGCIKSDDDSIMCIARDCVYMRKLYIAACCLLTDRCLGFLETHGRDLEELDIVSCVGTSLRARNDLVVALPLVRVYYDKK